MHVLDTLNFTDEERMAYEDHLKWLRIEANTIEKYRKEAEQKGRQEGKLEIAKSMLLQGYAIEDIGLLTSLSRSDIQKIT